MNGSKKTGQFLNSIIGAVIFTIGIYYRIKSMPLKRDLRILSVVGCLIVLFNCE